MLVVLAWYSIRVVCRWFSSCWPWLLSGENHHKCLWRSSLYEDSRRYDESMVDSFYHWLSTVLNHYVFTSLGNRRCAPPHSLRRNETLQTSEWDPKLLPALFSIDFASFHLFVHFVIFSVNNMMTERWPEIGKYLHSSDWKEKFQLLQTTLRFNSNAKEQRTKRLYEHLNLNGLLPLSVANYFQIRG